MVLGRHDDRRVGDAHAVVGEDDLDRPDDNHDTVDELRLERDLDRVRRAVDREIADRRDLHRLAAGGRVSPSSIGWVSTNVASGNSSVSSAPRALSSRRLSLVVIASMFASIETAVTVVPSIVIVPATSGVRPTAVVEPIPLNSSSTRNPTNVPVESSKLNDPIDVSTVHVPAMPVVVASAVPAAVVAGSAALRS